MTRGGIAPRCDGYSNICGYDTGDPSSCTLTFPAEDGPMPVEENDLLIIVLTHKSSGWATFPGDWTLIVREISGATRGEAYWKRAGASETGPYSITGMDAVCSAMLMAFANCITTGNPIDAAVARANASGTTGTAGVTTTVDNALVFNIGCSGRTTYFDQLYIDNLPGTGSDRAYVVVTYSLAGAWGGGNCTTGMSYQMATSAGASGATSYTMGYGNYENVGICFALKPDPNEVLPTFDVVVTGEPTNITETDAYEIPSAPYCLVQDLSEADPAYDEFYFKYTPKANEVALKVLAWVNPCLGHYVLGSEFGYGTPGSVDYQTGGYPAHNLTEQLFLPVVPGETYYIHCYNAGGMGTLYTGVELIIQFDAFINQTSEVGDVYVPDDSTPWPMVTLDHDTGLVRRYDTWPANEDADWIPGYFAVQPSDYRGDVWIYDSQLNLLTTVVDAVPAPELGAYLYSIVGGWVSRWYASYQATSGSDLKFITVTSDGTVAGSWSLKTGIIGYYFGTIAANPDETILYWANTYPHYEPRTIHRYDLVNHIALSDLTTTGASAGYEIQDNIRVMHDGTVLAAFEKSSPLSVIVQRFATDGTLLNTYDLGAAYYDRMIIDVEDGYFWVWTFPEEWGDLGWRNTYTRIRASDGTVVKTFDTENQSTGWEMPRGTLGLTAWPTSESCPMFMVISALGPTPESLLSAKTLVHAFGLMEGRGGWFYDDYTPDILTHYGDEGSNIHAVLCGGVDGGVYQLTGPNDNGTAIACNVRVKSEDQNDTRYQKLYGDVMLDCHTQGTDVTVTPGFDNHEITKAPVTVSNVTRLQVPVPFGTDWVTARNVSIDLAWDQLSEDRAYLYTWEPRFTEEGAKVLAYSWETCFLTHDLPGYYYHGWLYLVHISTANLTFSIINEDGTTSASVSIAASGGTLHSKTFVRLPVVKGKLFMYRLTSSGQFRVEGQESELLVKAWGEGGPWKHERIFQDIPGGTAA